MAGGEAVFRDGASSATIKMMGKNLELKGPSDGCVTVDGKCVKGIFTSLQTEVDENVDAISKLRTAHTDAVTELRADMAEQNAALLVAIQGIHTGSCSSTMSGCARQAPPCPHRRAHP